MSGTLYEHVGGQDGLQRLVAAWYPTVLADPLLQPLFGCGHADHVPHREALRSYLDFGTHVATQNSHATTDTELHRCQEVHRWSW